MNCGAFFNGHRESLRQACSFYWALAVVLAVHLVILGAITAVDTGIADSSKKQLRKQKSKSSVHAPKTTCVPFLNIKEKLNAYSN